MSESETQQFVHADQSLKLKRYPFYANSQLRAWDAADLYLLSEAKQRLEGSGAEAGLCIVHDQFGALTLPLFNYRPIVYGDSWLSFEAIRRNMDDNCLDNSHLVSQTSFDLLSAMPRPDLVIGRVPKMKSQLAALLVALRQWVPGGCELLLAGMDKHLSRGQFELLSEYFGPAEFYPGVKKARIWRAQADSSLTACLPKDNPVELSGYELKLVSAPNVFSRERLDIGSRFMLQNMNLIPERHLVADLACGNGVLGLAYMRQHAEAVVHFYDESFQAIDSTERNLKKNFVGRKAHVQAGDGLKNALIDGYELILCNPPFHQQTTVSTEIARGLFSDCLKALVRQGELWVVANRHLGYHKVLKSLFGNCRVLASDHKFVLLQSIN